MEQDTPPNENPPFIVAGKPMTTDELMAWYSKNGTMPELLRDYPDLGRER
jgi:uncharacterized protein (DUF433 family)